MDKCAVVTISPYFSLLQLYITSAVGPEESSGRHCLLPVHRPVRQRVLPPVPGLVVLLGKPGDHQVPDSAPHSPTPRAPGARAQLSSPAQPEDRVPSVPQGPRERHGPGHVRLRVLLPLRLQLCEGSPALPSHRLCHRAAAPGQTLLS